MTDSEVPAKELAKAKDAAYRYLSYRARSRTEVERKLAEKSFSDPVIRAVLTDLDRFGYINDAEFAGLWTRSRISLRGFGRRRIEQELRDKGVSREIITETLRETFKNSPELEVARREAEKKAGTLGRLDPPVRRRRLAGFLERKGFSFDTIRAVLSELK